MHLFNWRALVRFYFLFQGHSAANNFQSRQNIYAGNRCLRKGRGHQFSHRWNSLEEKPSPSAEQNPNRMHDRMRKYIRETERRAVSAFSGFLNTGHAKLHGLSYVTLPPPLTTTQSEDPLPLYRFAGPPLTMGADDVLVELQILFLLLFRAGFIWRTDGTQ